MKSAFNFGISVLFGLLVAGQLMAQELPSLEPIPSPAADGGAGELPALELTSPEEAPNSAGYSDLQPIPESTPLKLSTAAESEPTSNQATYDAPVDAPIVEGPFSTIGSEVEPALHPIPDQTTEFQPQPIQLQDDSTILQPAQPAPQAMIESFTSEPLVINSPASTVEYPIVAQPVIEQPIYSHSQPNSQPVYAQPVVTYQQPPVPAPSISTTQTTYGRPIVICPPQAQRRQPVQQKVVVKAAPAQKYYYRVDPRQAPAARPQPQQTVIVRQSASPANAPRPQQVANRYYVVPQSQSQVQQAQYQQVQRVPQQAPPAARPVTYQVDVTETTTQYRPVQVRVTETYQPAPRPTTIKVVVPVEQVPFQPFRNAVRRRW